MISIIAAIGKNRELGKDNQLLWHLPNDLKRFKQVTLGHDVIMGRKTFESLGRPLPKRTNIIISRNRHLKIEGVLLAGSLKEAIEMATDSNPFILGGGEIYKQAIEIADELDLTLVDAVFEADTFFPEIDPLIWEEASREHFSADDKHAYPYSFVKYLRK